MWQEVEDLGGAEMKCLRCTARFVFAESLLALPCQVWGHCVTTRHNILFLDHVQRAKGERMQ